MDPNPPEVVQPSPPIWRWVVGFLLVGAAWGLTTPFMRRAALTQKPQPPRLFLTDPNTPWIKRKIWGVLYAVLDLLKRPAYAITLLLNVSGGIWYFLLIGQAGKVETTVTAKSLYADYVKELSLTVPITNSVAFLFTVLGEWWAEGKAISRG